jgi:hypothetical protein
MQLVFTLAIGLCLHSVTLSVFQLYLDHLSYCWNVSSVTWNASSVNTIPIPIMKRIGMCLVKCT